MSLSEAAVEKKILDGDDFIQWSLRYGLVVFDHGLIRRAVALMVQRRPWPDAARKARHADKSMELAGRFVASGDQEAALIQVRTALSLVARAFLLSIGVFPLSRAEVPTQLSTAGWSGVGAALESTIHGDLDLDALAAALDEGKVLLNAARHAARPAPAPSLRGPCRRGSRKRDADPRIGTSPATGSP
jgi:hypothetical protein